MNETGREILLSLGIKNFNEQVLMFDKFLVDVLIPDKNLIIHWDGHYWHSKPRRILLDKSQDAYLEKCGYKVLRITDLEIKNNKERVYDNIKRAIR
jgi:very-short-patch-repair endonuclease